jgi:hypothetical protein
MVAMDDILGGRGIVDVPGRAEDEPSRQLADRFDLRDVAESWLDVARGPSADSVLCDTKAEGQLRLCEAAAVRLADCSSQPLGGRGSQRPWCVVMLRSVWVLARWHM